MRLRMHRGGWRRDRRTGSTRRAAAVLVTAALSATVLTGAGIMAASAAPGTPEDPTVLYAEGFENGTGTTPVNLEDYSGSTGQTYTADDPWLTNCNGQIVNYNTPVSSLGNCATAADAAHLRQLAWALGQHAGAATPASNHAVTAYTEGNPGADAVEFATVDPIPLASATGRFLTFQVDTAAVNCTASAPRYQFSFLDDAGTATPVGGVINACSSGQTVTAPAVGSLPADTVNVGTYTSDGSVLLSGASVGVQMANLNGSGGGNDAAFDNIRILDVTPTLDKAFSPASATTGGTSTLTFTITNTSELAAKNGWSFTDSLPDGLTVATPAGASTTCPSGVVTAPAGSDTVDVTGNLSAGMTSCTVSVDVTADDPGTYTNGPSNVDETGLNPPGSTSVTFSAPDVEIVKHAGDPVDVNGNGIADAGDTIAYTFTVTNSGDVTLDDIAVDDPMIGAVTCPQSSLAPGEDELCTADAVYTITTADETSGSVDNSATATATDPVGNPVTSDPSTTSTPVEAADPSLTLVKSADPIGADRYDVGQTITYTFVVTNTGNVPLEDLTIDEGAFTGTGAMSAITCPSTTVAVDDQVICTATYTLTPEDVDAGSLTNSATAEGTPPGETTPTPSDPSEVTIPTPAVPSLEVVKTATPTTVTKAGETVTYSFLVTNTGNVTLTDVTVDEGAFSGTGTLSAVTCPQTSLIAGEKETCTATYTVTQADVDAGTLTNTATATGTPPGGGTPVPSDPSDSTVDIDRNPAMTVKKTADVVAAKVGQTVTYTFVATNTGNVTITDPEVTEGDFTGTGTLSALACPATGSLAPGAGMTCTATYVVTQADVDAGSVENTATATGTPPGGLTPPVSPPSTSTVTTSPKPALRLVKTADAATATHVGQVITYTFTVTNIGNVTITDPEVTEGEFSGAGDLSAVDCPEMTTLLPGEAMDCTATYTVKAADLDGGKLTNTATAGGDLPGGGSITSDPSTANVKTRDVDTSAATDDDNGGGTLPNTGGPSLWLLGGALGLIAAGGVTLLTWWRRGRDVSWGKRAAR
jgi:uncharacterized repeat protein (TIGR01451 family)